MNPELFRAYRSAYDANTSKEETSDRYWDRAVAKNPVTCEKFSWPGTFKYSEQSVATAHTVSLISRHTFNEQPLGWSSLSDASINMATINFLSIHEKGNALSSQAKIQNFSSKHTLALQLNARTVLSQVYAKSLEGSDAEALKALFESIENAFAANNLEFIDTLLAEFQPQKVKRMVSVGVLRSTFRARSVLESWRSCLTNVAHTLQITDQRPAHLLRGLINTNARPLLTKSKSV